MHNDIVLPKYIAICGQPKTGKSLVQEILAANYGARPIDSGLPLRQIAMEQYGLTRHQVFTQEGKLEYVEILGRKWQVRELLGELGNRFEEMHGDWATPWMNTRSIPENDAGPFCDASCRKTQGLFYKQFGGIVIGITRPDVKDSIYAFDQVRKEIPDVWINNDALARGLSIPAARADLEQKIDIALRVVLKPRFDTVNAPIPELAQRAHGIR